MEVTLSKSKLNDIKNKKIAKPRVIQLTSR